ncbi:MAG: DMT family transporter [Candidatus Aminicenantes bacterium]|nr:DMT family transporter [Candidatus Aminicenantes bacterium]
MKQYKDLFAQAGLLYSAAIWGSTFFLVKNALNHISPLALIAYRFLIAAFLMFIFLKVKKKKLFRDAGKGLILGIILWVVYFPQTLGLKFTTASNSGFITGLFILFVPIVGWLLFKRIPELNKIFSVVLALTGLWILTGGPGKINYGDTLTLITAVAYAFHILYVGKYMASGSDPYILTFQQFLFVGLFSLAGSLFSEGGLTWSSDSVWWIIVFLAVFPTMSAFLIQMVSQRFTSPLRVAIIFSMEPVFAAIFAWTIGGERFALHRGIGGLIIVAAILVSELPTSKKKRSQP